MISGWEDGDGGVGVVFSEESICTPWEPAAIFREAVKWRAAWSGLRARGIGEGRTWTQRAQAAGVVDLPLWPRTTADICLKSLLEGMRFAIPVEVGGKVETRM